MARNFSNWLRAYMAYTEFTEAPEVYNYWVAVSTVAAALQGKTWFSQGFFSWSPNFYILLVGPPGLTKTTAINTGMKLLRENEGVKFGAPSSTWQARIEELAETAVGEIDGDDILTSACRPHASITYCVGELGDFLDPQDQQMMSALTSLWGGDGTGIFDRHIKKEARKTIHNPWVNIIAGTTPTWITANLPHSLIGTGFTSRCVLVYAQDKRNLVAYPEYEAIQRGDEKIWGMAIPLAQDLLEIYSLQGAFTMTREAYVYGTEWYRSYHEKPPVNLSPEDFGGYLNRRQAHAHKIAMVLSAAQGSDMIITEKHLHEAVTILEATEKTMPIAIGGVHVNGEMRPQLRIEEVLKKHGTVSLVELYQRFRNELQWRDFQAVIINLCQAGLAYEDTTARGKVVVWKGVQVNGLFSK